MLKKIIYALLITVFVTIPTGQSVLAVTDFESEAEIPFFDPNACDPNGTPQPTTSASGGDSISSVYMRGDSITLGAKDSYKLKERFENKDINATITASGGGTVSRAGSNGDRLSGLEAIEKDKDKIKDVDAVVIAYGTNNYTDPDDLFEKDIKNITKTIKTINSSAKLFWVNIKIKDTDNMDRINKIIKDSSSNFGYSVIDFASSSIPLGDAFHPDYSEKGFGKWGDLVVEATVGSTAMENSPDNSSGAEACCNTSQTGTLLSGSNNEEKVWNFLISKGMTVNQTAGIMGNIRQESGFNPEAVNPGSGAYGLIQWYQGREVALENYAKSVGKQKSDISMQLDFMWKELNEGYKTSVFDPIKATDDMSEVTRIWLERYEIPCMPGSAACQAEHSKRMVFADTFRTEYGDGSPTSTTSITSTTSKSAVCCTENTAGSVAAANDGSPSEWVKMYTGVNRSKVDSMAKGDISKPNTLVIHYTVGSQEGQALLDFFSGVSTGIQFNVGKDGKVYQYYPLNDMRMTYHAKGVNQKAIGIEITGYSSHQLIENEEQFTSVASLVKFLCEKYNIPCSDPKGEITNSGVADSQGLLGHDEVPTNDHSDPDAEYSSIENANRGAGGKVYGTDEVWTSASRKDSSKHKYMMKLRESLGFNPTPGAGGTASGSSSVSSGGGAGCTSPDTLTGKGTKENPVGEGVNRTLALEAVKYDTRTNNNKYTYKMGGLHGPVSELEDFAENGGVTDCTGFTRYIIWRVYGVDIGGMSTHGYPTSQYFKEIEAKDVEAGDIGWRKEHVDFITENKGGGKLHQFGAHSTKDGLFGGETSANEYTTYLRYIGPKKAGGGN